jgi:ribosomal protein L11 methyltransferase
MSWLQAHLTVDKTSAPLVELLFEQLGAVAVSMGDAGDEPMLEPPPGAMPLWQATRVSGLFDPSLIGIDALRSAIIRALDTEAGPSLSLEWLEDRDWERAWMDQYRPMRFGNRLWIRPSGFEVDQPGAVIVDLDPGLAFGTGTHPTTALCLEWLDAQDLQGRSLVDFGCGSGVLAIAALKLGAGRATALDHDPQALTATRENAARNGVQERLTVAAEAPAGTAPADVVVANILANVLVALAPRIIALVRPGGQLALSGILAGQDEAVAAAYAEWVDFETTASREEWVLLRGTRRA